jgi:hypothetical protein
VRRARSDELGAVVGLVGERTISIDDIAAAIACGHVLVLDEGDQLIAAVVVGPGAAPRLRLLVVHPSITAPGVKERMQQAAATLMRP